MNPFLKTYSIEEKLLKNIFLQDCKPKKAITKKERTKKRNSRLNKARQEATWYSSRDDDESFSDTWDHYPFNPSYVL